jgi:hypothetical protein
VITGETLLEHRLVYPYGQITISDDGRTALVTDPSRFMIYDSPSTLDVFELEQNRHMRRFVAINEDGEFVDSVFNIGQAHFVPGSDRVIAAADAGPYRGVGPLHVISLSRLTIDRLIWTPWHYEIPGQGLREGAYVGGIAVGPQP